MSASSSTAATPTPRTGDGLEAELFARFKKLKESLPEMERRAQQLSRALSKASDESRQAAYAILQVTDRMDKLKEAAKVLGVTLE